MGVGVRQLRRNHGTHAQQRPQGNQAWAAEVLRPLQEERPGYRGRRGRPAAPGRSRALRCLPRHQEALRASCLKCHREIAPSLGSIKHAGTGACRFCGGYGIGTDDALIYLTTHQTLGAAKIGIAKMGNKRLDQHRARGWTAVKTVNLPGGRARAVEHAVLTM
ncbi:hypothetical protein ACIF80_32365 [Streptomyces sp. NPDC085927]|uniref:hypothetical protein n=1 Tax=Streptomyces sp. NPDC085927 TaxID=3365738 RepID=UPI0037D7285C